MQRPNLPKVNLQHILLMGLLVLEIEGKRKMSGIKIFMMRFELAIGA